MSPPLVRTNQLAWESSPPRELVRLSWPMIVSLLSVSVASLLDTLFVGRLGAVPLAAVGLGGV
ncbi:MAG TPA: MATE family efflux transporter, partial [Polyangiaceae bacterium]|nr:MATE family efflux transporter [Polyangiaceae bacterium]